MQLLFLAPQKAMTKFLKEAKLEDRTALAVALIIAMLGVVLQTGVRLVAKRHAYALRQQGRRKDQKNI